MPFIKCQVLKVPRKKDIVEVLALEGEFSGKKIKLKMQESLYVNIRKRNLVRVYLPGPIQKINKVNRADVVLDIKDTDVEALLIHGFLINKNEINETLKETGFRSISDTLDYICFEENYSSNIIGEEKIELIRNEWPKFSFDIAISKIFNHYNQVDEVNIDVPQIIMIYDFIYNRLKYNCKKDDSGKKILPTSLDVYKYLVRNPWIIMQIENIPNAKFIADKVAKHYNIGYSAECIATILVSYLRNFSAAKGHTAFPNNKVFGLTRGIIKERNPAFNDNSKAESKKLNEEAARILQIAKEYNHSHGYLKAQTPPYKDFKTDGAYWYLAGLFYSENDAAVKLLEIAKSQMPEIESGKLIEECRKQAKVSDEQATFLSLVANNPVTVLSGPAGSGKSHILKTLANVVQDRFDMNPILIAPTGLASQRAAAQTNIAYSTIHKAVKYIQDDSDYVLNPYKPDESLANNLVIVDEMSMCTLPLFNRLLYYVNRGARLVLAGDPHQLPPIGPGRIFHDLLYGELPIIATISFTQIYRYKDAILSEARKIRERDDDKLEYVEGKVIHLSGNKKYEEMKRLYKESIKTYGIENVMVLSPRRTDSSEKSIKGTNSLNSILKKIANPSGQPVNGTMFSVGDIIIATRNDYQDGKSTRRTNSNLRKLRPESRPDIFNGTRGKIISIVDEIVYVEMHFPGGKEIITYKTIEVEYYLELAYAMTVHKAQGGQAKIIFFVTEPEPKRSMYYTAFTRAQEKIVIVGGIKELQDEEPPISFFTNRYMWADNNPDNPYYNTQKKTEKIKIAPVPEPVPL